MVIVQQLITENYPLFTGKNKDGNIQKISHFQINYCSRSRLEHSVIEKVLKKFLRFFVIIQSYIFFFTKDLSSLISS